MLPYMPIDMPPYAAMALAGAFAALVFLYFRSARYHITPVQCMKLFALCALTCFLGSKLLALIVIFFLKDASWQQIPTLFLQGGYVFYGGLFGTLFGIWLFVRTSKDLRLSEMLQMAAPALPLFHGFGRIGCALAGCCYGVPLSPPLVLLDTCLLDRFPAQLIEAAFEFSLFGLLCFLDKYQKKADLLKIYLLCYAIFRFFLEDYRADIYRGIWAGLSTSQWISMGIILFYAFGYLKLYREKKFFRTLSFWARQEGNTPVHSEKDRQEEQQEGRRFDMFCENCGNQILDGGKFCSECGTPVGGTSQGQVPPQVPPQVLPQIQPQFRQMPPGTMPPAQPWPAPGQQQQNHTPADKKKLYMGLAIAAAAAVFLLAGSSYVVYQLFFAHEELEEPDSIVWASEADLRARGIIPRESVANKKKRQEQKQGTGASGANSSTVNGSQNLNKK